MSPKKGVKARVALWSGTGVGGNERRAHIPIPASVLIPLLAHHPLPSWSDNLVCSTNTPQVLSPNCPPARFSPSRPRIKMAKPQHVPATLPPLMTMGGDRGDAPQFNHRHYLYVYPTFLRFSSRACFVCGGAEVCMRVGPRRGRGAPLRRAGRGRARGRAERRDLTFRPCTLEFSQLLAPERMTSSLTYAILSSLGIHE